MNKYFFGTIVTFVAISLAPLFGIDPSDNTTNVVNGVAVDFGTSSGSGNLASQDPALNGSQFKLGMTLLGMDLLEWTPDRVVIDGYWTLSDGTELPVDIVAANVAGSYAGTLSTVSYSNPGTVDNRIIAGRTDWPFLNMNGTIANITYQISDAGLSALESNHNYVTFQGTFVFYRGGTILEKGRLAWSGTLQ